MAIEVIKYRSFEKHTLRGFVDLKMTQVGVTIRECTFHEKNGKRWIGMPARPYEKDGSTEWVPTVVIDKSFNEVFQKAAIEALGAFLSENHG